MQKRDERGETKLRLRRETSEFTRRFYRARRSYLPDPESLRSFFFGVRRGKGGEKKDSICDANVLPDCRDTSDSFHLLYGQSDSSLFFFSCACYQSLGLLIFENFLQEKLDKISVKK